MDHDQIVVDFNESLRNFSQSVKNMNAAGMEVTFTFAKNRLSIFRDGVLINSMYVNEGVK